MLLTTCIELKHIKAYKNEPFSFGKSSRRYLPYSNVDIFLKICKILGLTGIDLFSPSDVVEKKNTRKVCMCIRLLSKKARSKHLSVPDFDVVSYTVAMPTDMVRCIRRSLEQSRHMFLSTASQNLKCVLTMNSRERNPFAGSNGNHGLFPEESDDIVVQSGASLTYSPSDASSQKNYYSVDSPQVSAVVEKCFPGEQFSSLVVANQDQNEYTHKFESPCLNDPAGSICSQLGENDYHLDVLSSTSCVDSPIRLDVRASHIKKTRSRHSYEISLLDFRYGDLDMQTSAGEEDSTGDSTQGKKKVLPLSISTMVCHEMDTSDPIQFDGDDSIFNGYTSPSSHGSNSTPRAIENGFRNKLADVNDEEFFSNPFKMSLPVESQNIEFNYQDDADHDFKAFSLAELQNGEVDNKFRNKIKNETVMLCSSPNAEKPVIDIQFIDEGFNTKLFQPCLDSPSCITDNSYCDFVYDNGVCKSPDPNDEGKLSRLGSYHLKNIHCNQCVDLLAQSYSPLDFRLWDQKGKCVVCTISDGKDGNGGNKTSPHSVLQVGLQGKIADCSPDEAGGDAILHEDIVNYNKEKSHSSGEDEDERHGEDHKQHELVEAVEIPKTTDDYSVQAARHKSLRRLLVKSVVSGSAVLGVVFVLLHLRKSGSEKWHESNTQPIKKNKETGKKLSPQNEQKNGIYPAKKLAFGF
ncbi:uncharacterized protein LOC123199789 isoform X3 [Mangifera indica]|nr:uncharacterized protein LOC123199789 isoform X3 [Mangifera indica]